MTPMIGNQEEAPCGADGAAPGRRRESGDEHGQCPMSEGRAASLFTSQGDLEELNTTEETAGCHRCACCIQRHGRRWVQYWAGGV